MNKSSFYSCDASETEKLFARDAFDPGYNTPNNELEHDKTIPTPNPDSRILQEICMLLKEQNNVLQLIEKRQADADISMQPVTPLPARSSSVWNSLLRSTMKNAAPTLDRWRGGLDTLLIFIGLFSAIITAFLVESLKTLHPNDIARTNELLANLTDVIIMLNIGNSSAVDFEFRQPGIFVPTSSDVRINIYWSIALVISLSVAALSVAGRSFLYLLMKAEGDAASKLTEIHMRWDIAKSLLGPCLEGLPQVLLIPVALFISGLLDSLFSLSSEVSLMNATFYICALSATITAIILLGSLYHGIHYSKVSPFQTSLSRFLSSFKQETGDDAQMHTEADMLLPHRYSECDLSLSNLKVFHVAIQEAFDDETLEQASAALEDIMTDSRLYSQFCNEAKFPDIIFQTILHLLSPEASFRSNLSAAKMIRRVFLGPSAQNEEFHTYGAVSDSLSSHQRATLLTALRRATEDHLIHRPHMINEPPITIPIDAMASLIPLQGRTEHPHPIISLLSVNYLTRQPNHDVPPGLFDAYNHTIWLAISVLARLLTNHPAGGTVLDCVNLNAVTAVFGPCTLQPICGKELLLSMMNSPKMTANTSYQDSVKYELITDVLVSWVAVGEHALQTTITVVDTVLLEYLRPDSTSYQSTHRSYHRVVHHLMMLVYRATEVSSPQNLSFCTKFILKVSETFIWDVGRFMSLRIILRFLVLLDENAKLIDRRNWVASREALTYVYRWTLYRAASFGDYDIAMTEFQDIMPPRDIFLSLIHKECLKISGKYVEAGSSIFEMPHPLPGWGLSAEEEQRVLNLSNIVL